MKAADQNVGLAASFGQLLDLQILGRDLATKKIDFTFEAGDIAVVGRGLSRRVGARRSNHRGRVDHDRRGDICCGRSRQAGAGRARKFYDLGDVTCDRLRRDHVFVAERGFLS